MDIEPVDRAEFFAAIGPCLALASGVGMSKSDQRIWLEAAFKMLDGVPVALLERGARAAAATADHPSKIVPAIMREIKADWEWRLRMARPDIPRAETLRLARHAPPLNGDEIAKVMSSSVANELLKMAEPRGWLIADETGSYRDGGIAA